MSNFFNMVKRHASEHADIFMIIFRVLCYALNFGIALFLAGKFFHDTYAANYCLFIIFSTGYELAMKIPTTQRCIDQFKLRLLLYIGCIFGLGVLGTLLIAQAGKVSNSCKNHKCNSPTTEQRQPQDR